MLTQKQIKDAHLILLKELTNAKMFRDESLSPIARKYWQAQEIYQEAEEYKETNIIISIQEAEVLRDAAELLLDVLDYQNAQQKTLCKLSAILEESEKENK